ncbi:MAG: prephenate dehydrogenase/arogenate dehydrogenase family protein, partial [Candidatus Electrothrix sp. AR3]|nr:prephenate dehydrogenase/arogenate dehydrogenase family protein [Candidatus Electrothrix sp. AR3]
MKKTIAVMPALITEKEQNQTLGTLGPEYSHAWQAAAQYAPNAQLKPYRNIESLIKSFASGEIMQAILPVYHTCEGENKQYFRLVEQVQQGFWIDNCVLPVNLSLGVLNPAVQREQLEALIGRRAVFGQCEEYITNSLPEIALTSVHDIDLAIAQIQQEGSTTCGIIDTPEVLIAHGLHIAERDVAAHNRTRYAVLGRKIASPTGYDATAFVTRPLDDRVGLLVDILSEFSRRGINILDMSSENDAKSQKLQVYIEAEGHIEDKVIVAAIAHIEERIIGRKHSIRLLGSFPRVDMRTKHISSFGFIGTGAMSTWFADRLENEGYQIFMSGRSTSLRPEVMIAQVDAVIICVPISATADTIRQYGPLIADGKALLLLAGESETTVNTALEVTSNAV